MRMIWRGWGLSALVAASLMLSSGTLRAADEPVVVHVKRWSRMAASALKLRPMAHSSTPRIARAATCIVLDLSGVSRPIRLARGSLRRIW